MALSRFAIVTQDEIEQLKSDSIPQKTKEATKYGGKIFQGKHLIIRKAFDIHFDTNESDNKLILLERRFDVIFTSFSSSIKVRYFLIVHMTSS